MTVPSSTWTEVTSRGAPRSNRLTHRIASSTDALPDLKRSPRDHPVNARDRTPQPMADTVTRRRGFLEPAMAATHGGRGRVRVDSLQGRHGAAGRSAGW